MYPESVADLAERQGAAHLDAVVQWIEPVELLDPIRQIADREIETAEQEERHNSQRNVII